MTLGILLAGLDLRSLLANRVVLATKCEGYIIDGHRINFTESISVSREIVLVLWSFGIRLVAM